MLGPTVASYLALCACATTPTRTPAAPNTPREGRVEWIRQSVQPTEQDPVEGAAADDVVGGRLGGMTAGRAAGETPDAAGGLPVDGVASQGPRTDRFFDVSVVFDDGARQVFRYRGAPPFETGQVVRQTGHGLWASSFLHVTPIVTAPVSGEVPAPDAPPTTPRPEMTPPPPSTAPPTTGYWAHTQQYGWIWMPVGAAYAFTPNYNNGDPFMYVYYPSRGWLWVEAPWLWGWGPRPYFRPASSIRFSWYQRGAWGPAWPGYRPRVYSGPRYRVRHPQRTKRGGRR